MRVEEQSNKWKTHEAKTVQTVTDDNATKNRFARKQVARTNETEVLSPAEKWNRATPPRERTIGWEQHNAKTAAPQKTNGGLIEDDSVSQARQAMIDAGELPKGIASAEQKSAPVVFDAESVRDMVRGFIARTPEFKPTRFNLDNLEFALYHFTSNTVPSNKRVLWNSAGIHAVFIFLRDNGYLEQIPGQKQAPKKFVSYQDQQAVKAREEQQKQVRAGKARLMLTKTKEVLTSEDEAKRMNFDALKRQVQSGYKKQNSLTTGRLGISRLKQK